MRAIVNHCLFSTSEKNDREGKSIVLKFGQCSFLRFFQSPRYLSLIIRYPFKRSLPTTGQHNRWARKREKYEDQIRKFVYNLPDLMKRLSIVPLSAVSPATLTGFSLHRGWYRISKQACQYRTRCFPTRRFISRLIKRPRFMLPCHASTPRPPFRRRFDPRARSRSGNFPSDIFLRCIVSER